MPFWLVVVKVKIISATGDMISIKFITLGSSFLVAATSLILIHRLPLELNWIVLVYFAALLNIAFAKHQLGLSSTKVFLTGWMLGTVISASELCFFFNIFSILALVLWTLFGLWAGVMIAIITALTNSIRFNLTILNKV